MAINNQALNDYRTKETFETFSFLPPMSQDEIYDQIAYVLANGWAPSVEHAHPSKAPNRYWQLWKLPFSGGQPQAQAAKSAPPQKSQQMQRATPAASSTARAASVARRQAMTSRGKVGIAMRSDAERTRAETARARPIERKADKDGCGCGGRKEVKEVGGASVPASDGGMPSSIARPSSKVKNGVPRRNIGHPEGRQLSQARRRLLAQKGRTALAQTDRARSPVERARHLNPDLTGRDLARERRCERSRGGDRGRTKSRAPSGRRRPGAGGIVGAAPSKVGISQTAQGQTVTGMQVGRSQRLTGDELSTCRVITGTEYLAADIFCEFC